MAEWTSNDDEWTPQDRRDARAAHGASTYQQAAEQGYDELGFEPEEFDAEAYRKRYRDEPDVDLLTIIPERLMPGELEDEPKRSRSILIAAALIGVAVAGAGAYAFLGRHVQNGGDVGVPIIAADSNPYKVKPSAPGGMTVPNQDKLVYDRIEPPSSGKTPGQVESLLPEPAVPTPPPAVPAPGTAAEPSQASASVTPPAALTAPATTPPNTPGTAPAVVAQAAPQAAVPPAVTPPPAVAAPAAPVPAPQPLTPQTITPQPVVPPVIAPDRTANAEPPAVKPAGPPQPVIPTAKPTTVAKPKPRAVAVQDSPSSPSGQVASVVTGHAAAPAGGFMIQLGALRDEAVARKNWDQLKAKFPELNGVTMVIQRADLGSKGIFYRLRGGGITSEQKARSICSDLIQHNQGCLFVGK